MDVVKKDMAEVEVMEEDTEDRNNWRWKFRSVATPDGKNRKKKKKTAPVFLSFSKTTKSSPLVVCRTPFPNKQIP